MGSSSAGLIRRRRGAVAAVVVVAFAAAAVAAWAAGSPVEGPQLETMALSTSDFSRGAAVAQEGFRPASPPVVAHFFRIFHSGARLARQRLLGVTSSVYVLDSTGTAGVGFLQIQGELTSAAGRRAIAAEVKKNVATSTRGAVRVKTVTFGRLVHFRDPQGAFVVSMMLHTNHGTIQLGIVGILLDRAVGLVELDGYPRQRISVNTAQAAATKLEQHFEVAFQIRNVIAPTITGTPKLGTTLTADRGRWAGGPSSYTYQWNHCDASGANCTPLAGATGQTYVPGTADAGTTINVTVTARNTVSTTAISSRPTAAVP
jgi:hypothetical protein